MSVQISDHPDVVDARFHKVAGGVTVPQNRHVLDHPRRIVALRNRIPIALTVNVVADLKRHDPTGPDPAEPVVYDGTDTGVGETAPAPQDNWLEHITSWWTGPWPELHCKVEDRSTANESIVVQVRSDLVKGHWKYCILQMSMEKRSAIWVTR